MSFFLLDCLSVIEEGHRLFKRQASRTESVDIIRLDRICESMKGPNGQVVYTHLQNCKNKDDKWDLACTFKDGSCFYFITCKYQSQPVKQWKCTEVHDSSAIPVCCEMVCRN